MVLYFNPIASNIQVLTNLCAIYALRSNAIFPLRTEWKMCDRVLLWKPPPPQCMEFMLNAFGLM